MKMAALERSLTSGAFRISQAGLLTRSGCSSDREKASGLSQSDASSGNVLLIRSTGSMRAYFIGVVPLFVSFS
jgi:hypothetical protein